MQLPYVERGFDGVAIVANDFSSADPRAGVGREKPTLFDANGIELEREYHFFFEPSSPAVDKWNKKFSGHRKSAEREASKARMILRKKLTQYLYEDGDLIEVYVFDASSLTWHCRWRKTPEGKIVDTPMKGEIDPWQASEPVRR